MLLKGTYDDLSSNPKIAGGRQDFTQMKIIFKKLGLRTLLTILTNWAKKKEDTIKLVQKFWLQLPTLEAYTYQLNKNIQ